MDSKIPSPDWQELQAQKLESSSFLLFLLALLPKVAPGLCSARKTDRCLPSLLQAHSSLLKASCFLPVYRVLCQTRKPRCPMWLCLRSFLIHYGIPSVLVTCYRINHCTRTLTESNSNHLSCSGSPSRVFREGAVRR